MVFRSGKSMRDIGNLLSYCQTNVQNLFINPKVFKTSGKNKKALFDNRPDHNYEMRFEF